MSTDMQPAATHGGSRRLLHRIGRVWRQYGVAGVWFRVLHDLGVYRCYVISSNPLDLTRVSSARIPCECALLQPDQVDEYMVFRPEQDRGEIRRQLDAGHICIVARQGDRIIGASWICGTRAYVDALGCELAFAEDAFYIYDNFVLPEYRGQEVMGAIANLRRPTAARAGFTRSVGVSWEQNIGATRRSAKRGSRRVGVVGFFGLGRWRRYFLHLSPSTAGDGPPLVRITSPSRQAQHA